MTTDHYFARHCPLHDEHVDPETGVCDHCERDARLDCTDCNGVGVLPCVDGWGAECSRPCHCQESNGGLTWAENHTDVIRESAGQGGIVSSAQTNKAAPAGPYLAIRTRREGLTPNEEGLMTSVSEICGIQDCERPVCARGWCKLHYYRWNRTGDPLAIRVDYRPAIERIWDKISGGDYSTCWTWTGPVTAKGYAQISDRGFMAKAHRVVYTFMVGEIPPGLELDHTCFNRACVNPWHLDPVTPQVNKARSSNALRTHCRHEFTPANTYITTAGGRQCRACDKSRKAERVAA